MRHWFVLEYHEGLKRTKSAFMSIPHSDMFLFEDVNATVFGYDSFDDDDEYGTLRPEDGRNGSTFLNEIPIGTAFLAALCALLFHYQNIGKITTNSFTLNPDLMFQNLQYYRLLSGTFLHGNLNHLVSNMIGALQHGKQCERVFGTLRLLEATLWSILLESIWVILLSLLSSTFRHINALGFSGVIYFWFAWHYDSSGTVDLFQTVILAFILGEEVLDLFKGKLGSFFHLLGFLNGILYQKLILYRWTVPSSYLRNLDEKLDDFVTALTETLGLSKFLYYISTAPEEGDEENSDESDSDQEDLESDEIALLRRGFVSTIKRDYSRATAGASW